MTDSPETPAEDLETAITEAVGWELRRVREERGWSRAQFVKRLPSGIGDRTLLAYEHGLRQLTVSRLLELAQALDIDAAAVLRRGLQRARLYLESLTLDVDLHMLLKDCGSGRSTFRPMAQWARNALNERPAGTAEVESAVVRNLALFIGCSHRDLAQYLAQFAPSADEGTDEHD